MGLPEGGPADFSTTKTSQPAEISECAHDTPPMLPPIITAFPLFFSISDVGLIIWSLSLLYGSWIFPGLNNSVILFLINYLIY